MNFNGKKILITRGNGFIGSNLSSQLRFLGVEVDTYDLRNGNDILDYANLESYIKEKLSYCLSFIRFFWKCKKVV